ncbi:hypothetical protein DBR11_09035 [Pedobacter sp. HMWF019]|uniref:right-handed parallel beta-helix repeat-containing protein n=1 Tax=Pedobacter sp. HMWF019 TaxID=2056856 RepID=UPI000D3AD880|nr:right-handed parallel beta-helix repeat-containing protein [Pedobacter sp. HMWF019]PTT00758.1 hypothetical protein DBR11_09035 [Pedobacter sp. HMWF019]
MKLFLMKLMATLVCSLIIFTAKAEDKTVDIADFAKYRRADDAAPMIRVAIAYCKQIRATKLIFPKATYYFKRDLAAEKYVFMSNNDEGLKRFVFDLSGMENLEIDGQGSKFILTGFLSPFLLENCRNISLRNFSIDYVRTFHSEAKILSVDKSGMTVQFDRKFPYKLDHQTLIFTDSAGVVYPWSDLLEFDPLKKETAFMANDLWVGSNVPVKEIKPGTVKLLLPQITGIPGNVMVFASAFRLVPAFNISGSVNISFSGIDIFHCGGMGIVAQNSRDLFLDHVRVTPSPGSGRIVSITADATHFSNCSGKITIENCLFENQKDDATNIHGIYSKITRINTPYEIEVELVHKQQFGFEYLKPDMKVEFADATSIVTYANNSVKSTERINKEFTRVVFADPISPNTKLGDVIACSTDYPEVLIRNCVIRGNRARGILLNSRGKTVVEHNTFHVPGAAILFEGDASFWFEQSGVNGVTIRNNTFDNCNYGVWGNACIQVGSGILKRVRSKSRYHKDISIVGNTFKIFDPRIINAYCVDGLIFKDNKIEQSEAYRSNFSDGKAFVIDACSNVSIDGYDIRNAVDHVKK